MISTDEPTPLLTPEELAAHYKVKPKTIRTWHLQGKIPAEVATGRILRFDGERVAEALRSEAMEVRKRLGGMCEII